MDHDRLFKELLTVFFAEFVEAFLPEVTGYLVSDTLEFLDKEIFTDVTAGEKHEADLVVKVRFRDQDAFFLVHVENQSTTETDFPRRMFTYFARLHEKY
jgi:predicted transposase/invertase (TIGR01784 family)